MDVTGKWRVAFMPKMGDENGIVWQPADALRETALKEQDKDMLMILDSLFIFEADGRVINAMKIPEGISREELQAAVEAGQIKLYGEGMFTSGRDAAWKLENGVLMYDTGIKGEVFGEPVSSWVEIESIDDMIELPFMRLRRAEEP